MIENMLEHVDKIYIAYGATDFRKQAFSLCALVKNHYNFDPYSKCAFIFCNKRRTSIKVLAYDKNGFILAQKILLNTDKMKFKWPKNEGQMHNINIDQLKWLLSGLSMYQKGQFDEYNLSNFK